MAEREREYKRLTRPVSQTGLSGLLGRCSLWLGKDHLLRVASTGYGETYKRFYFRDIQAISIRLTNRRANWNYFFGIPAAVLVSGGIPYILVRAGVSPGEIIALILLLAVFTIPLVINNLLGTTCACTIRTAVQNEDLPIKRLRRAERVMSRLRPVIAEAQGELSPGQMSALRNGNADVGTSPSANGGSQVQGESGEVSIIR